MTDLTTKVPPSWRGCHELMEIQRVIGLALDRLEADKQFWLAQFSIDTATVGLVGWEWAVGIETDLTLSLDWRRAKIKAKLQGLGVTTSQVICQIVESFTGGLATLQEGVAKHTFRVTVDGVLNPPEDMATLRHSVSVVKPAHLAHEYVFQYQSGQLPVGIAAVSQVVTRHHYRVEGWQ